MTRVFVVLIQKQGIRSAASLVTDWLLLKIISLWVNISSVLHIMQISSTGDGTRLASTDKGRPWSFVLANNGPLPCEKAIC